MESALQQHLAGLRQRVDLLAGADRRAFVDVESLLRQVYDQAKQGASYGHTKTAALSSQSGRDTEMAVDLRPVPQTVRGKNDPVVNLAVGQH